ncbi:MAG: helix-turn-helix transcriptional regulator [Thermoclostridium sp.]|nr:helix-turn-helix transcriptional regulator [Thermoclostridium sp.]
MILNETIKAYRKEMRMTQEQLAEAMGVTIGAVSKWESGLSNPDIMLLPKLAKLFGISLDVLFSFQLMDHSADDLAEEIKTLRYEKQYDKGAEVALNAIRRYPNHFDVIFQSAALFMMQGVERRNKESLEKAMELYRRSCPLVGQSHDEQISELSIQVSIGEILTYLGRTEEAYEHLKKYNYCGINNSIIGILLSQGKNPQEAFPYLSDCLLEHIAQFMRCCVGFANTYLEMKDSKTSCEVLNMMYDFSMHLKKGDQVSYIDKLQVILLAGLSQIYAGGQQFLEAEECLTKAYELAKKFDASPDYNAQNIKFYKGEKQIFGDDTGETAMESIERIISLEESNTEFLKKTLSNIANKLNKN